MVANLSSSNKLIYWAAAGLTMFSPSAISRWPIIPSIGPIAATLGIDCENSLAVESYDVAIGASGNGTDFSFHGIANNASGINDFIVPELPPLPVDEYNP